MIRGTRIMEGSEAKAFVEMTNSLRGYLHS